LAEAKGGVVFPAIAPTVVLFKQFAGRELAPAPQGNLSSLSCWRPTIPWHVGQLWGRWGLF